MENLHKHRKCLKKARLKPKGKEEQKSFTKFRLDDIAEMLAVPFVFSALMWLMMIINFFDEIYHNPLVILLRSLHTLFLFASWQLGTRYKKHLCYLIVASYVAVQIINASTIKAFLSIPEDNQSMMQLDIAFRSHSLPIFDFIFAALLMAPSISYVILYLIPLAAIIVWTVINAKEDNPALRYMS